MSSEIWYTCNNCLTMPCLTPWQKIDKETGECWDLPCGKCPECVKRRTNGWLFRLMQQEKTAESAYFVTLTYDNPPRDKNGNWTLQKQDLQKFFKRLRKLSNGKIKYYACGEYAPHTMRPHYHILLFNATHNAVISAWTLKNKSIGIYHFGNVENASAVYTMKYMGKPRVIPMNQNDHRQPEFSLMSKGIGLNYINQNSWMWHNADLTGRMYLNLDDGKKIAMPRYYKNLLYNEQERTICANAAIERASEAACKFWNVPDHQAAFRDTITAELQIQRNKNTLAAFKRQQKNSLKTQKL